MRKKKVIFICFTCVILCMIAICGCTQKKIDPEKIQVPEDFNFAITWNVYGISSYDSATGTLIKTTDATYPENYITNLELSEETLKEIYIKLTKDINLNSYKNEYNPFSFVSTPTQTIIISLTSDGASKTVSCEDIALGEAEEARTEKAKKFVKVMDEIVEIITATEEWKSLPDYEFGYD